MLYKVVLTFENRDKILSVAIQMKATEKYFTVVGVYYAVQDGSNFNSLWTKS